jgi:hypothetical protein
MRLVISYEVDTDNVSSLNNVPVNYESKEKFAADFETACRDTLNDDDGDDYFTLGGYDWYCLNHYDSETYSKFTGPKIMTVDEWFGE